MQPVPVDNRTFALFVLHEYVKYHTKYAAKNFSALLDTRKVVDKVVHDKFL